MATQANLYNRYRPQTFNEVVGQEAIFRILSNAVLKERIANAYLFRGPRGSGKTSVARILAKAANCENLKGFTACGKCTGCRYALHDSEEIDAASNRGIGDVKELIDTLRYRPQHVDKKFVIIDEAHQLTSASLNALLKVVEEPPPHVHFVFCTTENPSSDTDTDKAFVTLTSRCQILQFNKITPNYMLDKLARVCIAEERQVSQDILMGIVGKSDGSLRDAENILDILLTLYDYEPPERIIQFLYGNIAFLTLKLFKSCCVGTVRDGLLAVRDLWDAGCNPREVSDFCVNFVSSVIKLKAGLTVYHVSDIVSQLEEISKYVGQNRLESIAIIFSELRRAKRDNILDLEMAVCDVFADSKVEFIEIPQEKVTVTTHSQGF